MRRTICSVKALVPRTLGVSSNKLLEPRLVSKRRDEVGRNRVAKLVFTLCVGRGLSKQVSVTRPTDWNKVIGYLVFFTIVGGSVIIAYRNFSWIFSNKIVWAVLAVGWVSVMTSGYMWNQIRHPPYTGVRDGKPEVFAPGFQNQFVLETQIITLVCGLKFLGGIVCSWRRL